MATTTIKSIELFDDLSGLGYRFIMSDSSQNITCKMQNDHLCCESFGVYTASNLDDFVGADFLSIETGESTHDEDYKGFDFMIYVEVYILTNKGKLTIKFYNEHNGYYTHDVFINSKSINKTDSI